MSHAVFFLKKNFVCHCINAYYDLCSLQFANEKEQVSLEKPTQRQLRGQTKEKKSKKEALWQKSLGISQKLMASSAPRPNKRHFTRNSFFHAPKNPIFNSWYNVMIVVAYIMWLGQGFLFKPPQDSNSHASRSPGHKIERFTQCQKFSSRAPQWAK